MIDGNGDGKWLSRQNSHLTTRLSKGQYNTKVESIGTASQKAERKLSCCHSAS